MRCGIAPWRVELYGVSWLGQERVPAAIRQEGDTTIYPVVEEVVVVEKRLRLVEEMRVAQRRATRHVREQVALRREEIVVEREAVPRDADRDPEA